MNGLTLTLVVAAASLGSVHTLAPDHWMPFAALARAEGWTARRTAAITAACGLGHVTVSVLLGLVSVVLGLELLQAFGRRLESIAGLTLIAFGVAYGAWGLHRAVQKHWHGGRHPHAHAHDVRLTPWMLFLVFCADPCVAVIPLMFAAAPLGWAALAAVVAAYETATIGTMVVLVLPARMVASAVRSTWIDRYGDVLAGGVIAGVGIAVVSLGL
jgi:nickel/cobalt exporter